MIDKYNQFTDKVQGNFYENFHNTIKENPVKNNISDYCDIKKIEKKCKKYFELSEQLFELYKDFFNDYKNAEGKDDTARAKAEKFLKTSDAYIMMIQNLYLNPINNRLTQLKANLSIYGAIFSIILAIMFPIFQCHNTQKQEYTLNAIDVNTKQTSNKVNEVLLQNQEKSLSDNISFRNVQISIEKLLEQGKKIINSQTSE